MKTKAPELSAFFNGMLERNHEIQILIKNKLELVSMSCQFFGASYIALRPPNMLTKQRPLYECVFDVLNLIRRHELQL